MAAPLIAFGRFLGSIALAGVMLLLAQSLGGQQNTVAAAGVAGGAA